jgi:hypothetical protein
MELGIRIGPAEQSASRPAGARALGMHAWAGGATRRSRSLGPSRGRVVEWLALRLLAGGRRSLAPPSPSARSAGGGEGRGHKEPRRTRPAHPAAAPPPRGHGDRDWTETCSAGG